MLKQTEYITALNQEFGLSMTGLSPLHGNNKKIPRDAARIVVKNFGNGLGRVLYIDQQNRLIANMTERLVVGLKEAAEMLGWSKQQVSVYINRDKFPQPSARLASGPLWDIEQIQLFRESLKSTKE